MPEICVIYLSEDEPIVGGLVSLLRKHWDVWWAKDISYGDWEKAVRENIPNSSAVVSVLSEHGGPDRIAIIRDEMHFAKKCNRPIFPFLIGNVEVPFGFGGLSDTKAYGWTGDAAHLGYQQLKEKIASTIGKGRQATPEIERAQELRVGRKFIKLPAFAFSLSSHETQIAPDEGLTLLNLIEPDAALVSAYDSWKAGAGSAFHIDAEKLKKSKSLFVLDSGNYEAYRKKDHYHPQRNAEGWRKELFRETAGSLSPDLAFSFDTIHQAAEHDRIIENVVAEYLEDDKAMQGRDFPLCPIVHVPHGCHGSLTECAAEIVSGVVKSLDPLLVAVPERELGDGLLERVKTVRDIRKALNTLGKYYPLHLLGTGNPISIVALAAAGADSFDGLEWCRTVADYDRGYLFHFQQFDCFSDFFLYRMRDQKLRHIVENTQNPYTIRTLIYNVDFFNDWVQSMQKKIHRGLIEDLLRDKVPYIGQKIYKVLSG